MRARARVTPQEYVLPRAGVQPRFGGWGLVAAQLELDRQVKMDCSASLEPRRGLGKGLGLAHGRERQLVERLGTVARRALGNLLGLQPSLRIEGQFEMDSALDPSPLQRHGVLKAPADALADLCSVSIQCLRERIRHVASRSWCCRR